MTNQLSNGTVQAGDIVVNRAKLDKAVRLRVGAGGTLITGSSEFALTGAEAVLPSQAVVTDVYVNVLTASTGATKNFGFGLLSTSSGGNRTGFLAALDVSTTGLRAGSVASGTSGAGTYGTFLTTQTTGNAPVAKTFLTDSVTAKTLSFTPNSTDWILFSADIYLCYVDFTK